MIKLFVLSLLRVGSNLVTREHDVVKKHPTNGHHNHQANAEMYKHQLSSSTADSGDLRRRQTEQRISTAWVWPKFLESVHRDIKLCSLGIHRGTNSKTSSHGGIKED
ncbi:hypothetical protein ElyMa_000301900 [Elysia marginata]|uniref:Secreted protein n=1 Tax=Elysia marginata TaxID=1093978 RepID=A0AAV4F908_9GAST|nr:hypothetical protein ElyMa_000301900 [Elysia marginata]